MAEAEQMSQLTSDKHSSVAGLCSYLDFLNWSCPRANKTFFLGVLPAFVLVAPRNFRLKIG